MTSHASGERRRSEGRTAWWWDLWWKWVELWKNLRKWWNADTKIVNILKKTLLTWLTWLDWDERREYLEVGGKSTIYTLDSRVFNAVYAVREIRWFYTMTGEQCDRLECKSISEAILFKGQRFINKFQNLFLRTSYTVTRIPWTVTASGS